MSEFDPDRALTSMAHDLTTLVTLYGELGDEALAHASHPDIPGGDALVFMGPAALTRDWQEVFEQAEEAGEDTLYANDQVAQNHILIVLGDWSESVRAERGEATGLRITVERAADYLRSRLPWIVEHFDAAPHMAAELRTCRVALENLVQAGVRHDWDATACLRMTVNEAGEDVACGGQLMRRTLERRDCKHAKAAIDSAKGLLDPARVLRRLLNEYPELELEHRQCDQGGRDDVYRCAKCGTLYDNTEYWNAVRAAYERRAGA